jgi:Beta-propeller repeat
MKRNPRALAGALLVTLAGGCNIILGLEHRLPIETDGGMGGGTSSTATSSATSSVTATSSSTTGGGCVPQSTAPCYDGPKGTKGIGLCKAGTQTCMADGMSYSACMGDVTPAQETCSNPADENCDSYDCVEYADVFGDPGEQEPHAVAVDASGNSYVVGTFKGAISLDGHVLVDAGGGDAFLFKLDPSGKAVWAKQFGDTSSQIATAVALDSSGNIFIAGENGGSFALGSDMVTTALFVAKLSPAGDAIWGKNLGAATGSTINGLATTPQNDVMCGGHFLGTINFGDGGIDANAGLLGTGTDGFIAKLRGTDGSGKAADGSWAKTFGDDNTQSLQGVGVDATGNVLIAGSFEGSINLGGVTLDSAGNKDVFLAKLGSTGNLTWQKRFGDPNDQVVTGFAVDSLGGALVAGRFQGKIDFDGNAYTAPANGTQLFVAKYTTGQLHEWSKAFGAGGTVAAAFDQADNVLLAGGFTGTIDLGAGALNAKGTDVFVAKLAKAGTIVWNKQFGDAKDQFAEAIATTAQGESVVAGVTDGAIDFGTGPLVAAGGWDIFVAKFGL